MKVSEALATRKSIRAFRPDPVSRETVEKILTAASRAPSGGNLQPWKVYVVTGEARAELIRRVAERRKTKALGEAPERLYKRADGTFATRSAPSGHIAFVIKAGHATRMRLEGWWLGAPLIGNRVGPGDARTFHAQLR
jgi:nitroreductase